MSGSITPQGGGGVPSGTTGGGEAAGPTTGSHTQQPINQEGVVQGNQDSDASKTTQKKEADKIRDKAISYEKDQSQTQKLQSKQTQQENLNTVTANKPKLETFDAKQPPEPPSKETLQSLNATFNGTNQSISSGAKDSLSFLPNESDTMNATETQSTQGSGGSSAAASWMGPSYAATLAKDMGKIQEEQRHFASAASKQIANQQNASWKNSVTAKDKNISAAKSQMWASEISGLAKVVGGGVEVAGAAASFANDYKVNKKNKGELETANTEVENTTKELKQAEESLKTKTDTYNAEKAKLDDLNNAEPKTGEVELKNQQDVVNQSKAEMNEANNAVSDAKKANEEALKKQNKITNAMDSEKTNYINKMSGLTRGLGTIMGGAGEIFAAPLQMKAATEQAQAQLDQTRAGVASQTAQVMAKALEAALQFSQSSGQTLTAMLKALSSGFN